MLHSTVLQSALYIAADYSVLGGGVYFVGALGYLATNITSGFWDLSENTSDIFYTLLSCTFLICSYFSYKQFQQDWEDDFYSQSNSTLRSLAYHAEFLQIFGSIGYLLLSLAPFFCRSLDIDAVHVITAIESVINLLFLVDSLLYAVVWRLSALVGVSELPRDPGFWSNACNMTASALYLTSSLDGLRLSLLVQQGYSDEHAEVLAIIHRKRRVDVLADVLYLVDASIIFLSALNWRWSDVKMIIDTETDGSGKATMVLVENAKESDSSVREMIFVPESYIVPPFPMIHRHNE